jgi:hypothetical protein
VIPEDAILVYPAALELAAQSDDADAVVLGARAEARLVQQLSGSR